MDKLGHLKAINIYLSDDTIDVETLSIHEVVVRCIGLEQVKNKEKRNRITVNE